MFILHFYCTPTPNQKFLFETGKIFYLFDKRLILYFIDYFGVGVYHLFPYMHPISKKEPAFLFIGDLLSLLLSLWLVLFVRYGQLPSLTLFAEHIRAFSFLFVFSPLIFFIGGFYEKRNTAWGRKGIGILLNAQLVNALVAIVFFYFIPYFGITPKTNLFLYFLVSSAIVSLWRLSGSVLFISQRRE